MDGPRDLEIHFDHGTLVVPQVPEHPGMPLVSQLGAIDERTGTYRLPARHYRALVLGLHQNKLPFADAAKDFERLPLALREAIDPFPHQAEALDAWRNQGSEGIVVLPTGAGKTILAVLAIQHVQRPAWIVVPTIGLMQQWQRVLQRFFDVPVGMLGGGFRYEGEPLLVSTYDSAANQVEFLGRRFGFLICDECHHLPAPSYRFIAAGCLAPFRLGLTATLERDDGGEEICQSLLGAACFEVPITALAGKYLAPYEVRSVEVELTPDEETEYLECRRLYLDFLRKSGVSFSAPNGWAQFIARAHRSQVGREAFAAYRRQRSIAFRSQAKEQALWEILMRHRGERILVFTEDNDTVYSLSRQWFLPCITHHTKPKERQQLLADFASGALPVLLTSKVLNEGVDVPEAKIGVVISGSGSVREHVQRLGRILRRQEGKRALLYEIYSRQTAESYVSERRRQHGAYLSSAQGGQRAHP